MFARGCSNVFERVPERVSSEQDELLTGHKPIIYSTQSPPRLPVRAGPQERKTRHMSSTAPGVSRTSSKAPAASIAAPVTVHLVTAVTAAVLELVNESRTRGIPLSRFRADLGALGSVLGRSRRAGHALLRALAGDSAAEAPRPDSPASPVLRLTPDEFAVVLGAIPVLEPVGRGRPCSVPARLPRAGASESLAGPGAGALPASAGGGAPVSVRQGRLGDCWFVAVMAACEHVRPGVLSSLVRVRPDGLVEVDLHGLRGPRTVVMSARVPPANRAGDRHLRPNVASLVEKALVVGFAGHRYVWAQRNFAGNALRVLTGTWCPARPVPRTLAPIAEALATGRPVVASTLVRPGGSFLLPREDDPARAFALMDGHVYVAHGVSRTDEDGRPDPDAPLRVHLHNPIGGPEGESRRTDLYLSARQFRRAFVSVNIGPQLH